MAISMAAVHSTMCDIEVTLAAASLFLSLCWRPVYASTDGAVCTNNGITVDCILYVVHNTTRTVLPADNFTFVCPFTCPSTDPDCGHFWCFYDGGILDFVTIEEVKNSGRYAEDVLYEEQNSKRQEVLTLQGVKNASNGSLIYCANISHRCNQFPNSYDHINAVIIKDPEPTCTYTPTPIIATVKVTSLTTTTTTTTTTVYVTSTTATLCGTPSPELSISELPPCGSAMPTLSWGSYCQLVATTVAIILALM